MSPVDNAFENIRNRPKWAIPWMEDDPSLTQPQLWVGRMRSDAVDALRYNCTGLIGIHWRTRILGPNISALARAGWSQSGFAEKSVTAGPKGENIEEFTYRYSATGKPIARTEDDTVYQTVRHELSAYRLEVPNGTYTVTLKFCEHRHDKKGLRIFGVKIQGEEVLDNLDIFAEVGKLTALDYSFKIIQVTDGWLIIDFIKNLDYPTVAAIIVQGDNYSKKINCGGPEYKDYSADWDRAQPRDLATKDFYDDWALHQFGHETSDNISQLFQKIDGKLPRPANWVSGPGGLRPDTRMWKEVNKEYEFVNDFEKLRPLIKGAGNLERFDYWLNNFYYMRATARVKCAWGKFNKAMEKIKTEDNPKVQSKMAKETALPLYKEMVKLTGDVYKFLLATVSNPGEMGNIVNWDQHILPYLIEKTSKELTEVLKEALPDEAVPGKRYTGNARIIVPTIRNSVMEGETLTLKAIILDIQPPKKAEIFWRPMGGDEYISKSLKHINRGVYSVKFPPDGAKEDIEYYIKIVTAKDKNIYFPAAATEINQTVVVMPKM